MAVNTGARRRARRAEPTAVQAPGVSALPWIALAALLAVAAAFLLHETRGTTLWFDEWNWALERRGASLDAYVDPANGHLALVPIAIYKLLFATAGLDDRLPFRLTGIGAHLLVVLLVFVYANRRVGGFLALLAAASILFLGPGWENIIWPLQVGWLVSLGAGIGALLMLDRGDRVGDAGASLLLGLSLASSGLGVAVAAGLVIEVLWGRRRLRAAWIVVAPLALYGLWWLGYQDYGLTRANIPLAPAFAADLAAGSVSSLAGLAGPHIFADNPGTLGWGRPLAVVVAGVIGWWLATRRPVPPRVLTLLTMALSFWLLTALTRASLGLIGSRYLYVGALFVLLLLVEVGRGVTLAPQGRLLVACAVALAVVANLGDLRAAGRFLRAEAEVTRADLGALELARPIVRPDFIPTGLPGYPLVVVRAGSYLAAAAELGSPAASAAEIAAAPEAVRSAVDAELVRIHAVAPRPAGPGLRPGLAPPVDGATGGAVSRRGACVGFRPSGALPADLTPEVRVTIPPGGLLVRAGDGPATISVRRFAGDFPDAPQGRLAASASATLRIDRDLANMPWHLRVAPEAGVSLCGLR